MIKHLPLAAAAVALMAPGAASAASKNNTLTVSLNVQPIILLFVSDNTMEMTANDINADNLDATGKTRAEGRAQFFVASNTGYDIALTAPTWEPTVGDNQVQFVGVNDNSNYIAGELFLDTDVSADAPTPGNTDIQGWSSANGNVAFNEGSRGVRRYGVGAIFDPQTWNGNSAEDLAGAPAGAASIAPPDVYSQTVTVTVTTS
ncbi:MAG: hypothetical protein MK179_21050 [Pirellulaceae bacterium]|nr:hypothetical protein [Pirellulaceae bacterium]